MRHHPLTPMKESYLPDIMDQQTARGATGSVGIDVVRSGPGAIALRLEEMREAHCRYAVVDTEVNSDFEPIAEASHRMKLVTGGSGLASAIPNQFRRSGRLPPAASEPGLPRVGGNAAILAGSCSAATRRQIEKFRGRAESVVIDPAALFAGRINETELLDQASRAAMRGAVMIHSAAEPERVRSVQQRFGVAASAELVENTIAQIAKRLADDGVRKFIIAGGETSGAVAHSLNLSEFRIGPQIDPGVPWLYTLGESELCVAFKSGNFGGPDFFSRALEMLP